MTEIRVHSFLIEGIRCTYNGSIDCSKDLSVKEFLNKLKKKLNRRYDDDDDTKYVTIKLKHIHCVYLKGKKLDERCLLKNYLDDLKYIPLFITNDSTKLIENSLSFININDYTNLELYDNGFLRSLIAVDQKTGQKVLLKSLIEYDDLESEYQALYSYKLASTLNHDGVVKILGFRYPLNDKEKTKTKLLKTQIMYMNKKIEFDLTGLIVVEEFIANRDIKKFFSDYLKSNGKKHDKLNPTIRSKIIYGVASAMKYVHEKGVIHDNLKLSNILFDENFEPKISGFNEAQISGHAHFKDQRIHGIPYILAPEKYMDPSGMYDLPVDVYSFAFFIYRMFSNFSQFSDKKNICTPQQFMMKIGRGIRLIRPENIQDSYWELIERCWKQNPEDRPTFKEIVEELKDDKYAIEEFGMKTDLDKLHEYQKRIDSCSNATVSKSSTNINDLKIENKQLHDQIDKFKSIVFPRSKEKNPDNYFIDENDEKHHQFLSKIDEGATSITYKIFDTETKKIMCKKIFKVLGDSKFSFKAMQNSIKEFEVLWMLDHPNICRVIGINTSEPVKDPNIKQEMTTISIFLEFEDYSITDIFNTMNSTLKTKIIIEIAHAMNYIHKKGLIHRDLKIDNIRLNSIFEAKIIDFGLVRIHEALDKNYSFVKTSMTKGVGTLDYMSPEMLNNEDYDYKTDVYSFGIVLHFIFVGSLPKQNLKDKMTGKSIKPPQPSESISKFCIDLFLKCLSYKPSERPSFDDILKMIRDNSYELASFVDQSIVSRKDQELELFQQFSK